jgi:1,4-dihydroxy-6-naphthoate synthase
MSMFDTLVHGRDDAAGLRFSPALDDIAVLDRGALGLDPRQPLPTTTVSVVALAHLVADYVVLDAGAVLGRGCGPLVLRRTDDRAAGTRPVVPRP